MKNISKSILKIIFISFFTILFSCEKDLYEESIINKSRATSQKVSISQVLSEINNPILKNYIKNELNQQIGISELRTNFEDYLSFIKIIKENEYTTYSLLINKYSESQPFEKYFVITKDGSTENAGYSKYIPNDPIIDFNPNNFTGKIQVIDLQNEVKSETAFINSIAQPQTESFNCVNSVSVIAHNCSNGGNHPPGTPCSNGNVNDGYWEIVTTVTCIYNNDYEYIAPPQAFMGEQGGGGSPATFNPNVLAFIYSLTDEEYNAIKDMPEVLTYLEENDSSIESQNFIRDIIYRILDNPGVFNSIKPFLIEKQIYDDPLDPCFKGILNDLKSLSNCDISKVLAKLDANNSVYKTVIKNEDFSPVYPAQTERYNPLGFGAPLRYNYIIKVHTGYNSSTKLFKASILLHELIHAYFFSLNDDFYTGNDYTAFDDFPSLYEKFVLKSFPGSTGDAHHHDMALKYVDAISRALQEYDTGIPVADDAQPNQIYKDLAWGGLGHAPIFNTTFPLGSTERTRILNRYACEGTNQQQGNEVPIGGNPCNE